MLDVVVTVPKAFTHPAAPGKKGLLAWIAEGDAAGDPDTGLLWEYSTYGASPKILSGERVYIVCENRLRGYAPLVDLRFYPRYGRSAPQGTVVFVRRGGAVAVTIPDKVVGFRGWKYRWWDRSVEIPFPDWKTP